MKLRGAAHLVIIACSPAPRNEIITLYIFSAGQALVGQKKDPDKEQYLIQEDSTVDKKAKY